MDVGWYSRLILLLICIIFSAFFSGAEVALFSIDRRKIKNFKEKKDFTGKYIFTLLETPRRLLVTILIGNTVFNVAASIISVTIAFELAPILKMSTDIMLVVQIFVLTGLILLFGEITPKVWASKHPIGFARIISIPLYWMSIIIYPISKIITELFKVVFSKVKQDKSKTAILSSELTELADLSVEKGTIEEDEHEMIHGLVSFKTVTTREVMTPRVDVTAISEETKFEDLMQIITDSGHSRIPLYKESLDNILGILYAKDLLPYVGNKVDKSNLSLIKIARKAIFIPETKLISSLMHEFQEKNMHIGIVVDEYGGTAGVISLEDILEEIVGEIRDEYDQEETEITKIDETNYTVLGKVSIDEINEMFEVDFSSENDDYDTIGGFILNLAGNIPEKGSIYTHNNFQFTIEEVENQRINRIQLKILD